MVRPCCGVVRGVFGRELLGEDLSGEFLSGKDLKCGGGFGASAALYADRALSGYADRALSGRFAPVGSSEHMVR